MDGLLQRVNLLLERLFDAPFRGRIGEFGDDDLVLLGDFVLELFDFVVETDDLRVEFDIDVVEGLDALLKDFQVVFLALVGHVINFIDYGIRYPQRSGHRQCREALLLPPRVQFQEERM